MDILVGKRVHDAKCSTCGCKTLYRVAAEGTTPRDLEKKGPVQIEMAGLPEPTNKTAPMLPGAKPPRYSGGHPWHKRHTATPAEEQRIIAEYTSRTLGQTQLCAKYNISPGQLNHIFNVHQIDRIYKVKQQPLQTKKI
jgi:hypothetical protein